VAEQTGGQVISLDGKTARGSRDRNQNRSALHTVSAWANDNRLVLGPEAVEEKSNEITAIPKLLALLELKGSLVTIEARGCQREIATQLLQQQGNSVLSFQGNPTQLHEGVKEFLETAEAVNYAQVQYDFQAEIDKGPGRVETRRDWLTEPLESLPSVESWPGLNRIGMVERMSWIAGKETRERRYFINSITADAKRFAQAVREHWNIENRLHWRLDVLFHEDANRIRPGNAPTIMTVIRPLCMGLWDADMTRTNLATTRRKASWNDSYRASLVFGKGFLGGGPDLLAN